MLDAELEAQAELAREAIRREDAGEPYTVAMKAKRLPDGWCVMNSRTFTRDGWTFTIYITPFASRQEAEQYIKRGSASNGRN